MGKSDLILTQELPAGLELARLEVALNEVFAGDGKREVEVSTSRRIGEDEGSLSVDLVGEVQLQGGIDGTLNLSAVSALLEAELGLRLGRQENSSLTRDGVGETHGGRDTVESIGNREVLVIMEVEGSVRHKFRQDLFLDGLENVGRVNGVETLVIVEEVQVDVKLRLTSGACFNLQLFLDLLELRADDGIFILVVKAESGFAEKMVNELLSVTRVNSVFEDLGKIRSNSGVEAVVKVRGNEGLESREESLVEDVTQAAVFIVVGLEEVGGDVRSPEEGLHERHNRLSLVGLFAVQRVLVVDLAGDGGVDVVGDLFIGLIPSAQGNTCPESLGLVADEQKSEGGQTNFSLLSLVEENGHQQRADNVLLLVGQVGQSEDSLGANDVAESLIFPIFIGFSASASPPGLLLFAFDLLSQVLGFDPLLSHFLLGQAGKIALVAVIPLIFVVRARLAAGDVRLDVRDNELMAEVTQGSDVGHTLTGVVCRLDLFGNVGDELVVNEGVARAAELTHDQLGEHVQAVGGVDASLVDQAREGQGSSDLKLLVLLNEVGLDEILGIFNTKYIIFENNVK